MSEKEDIGTPMTVYGTERLRYGLPVAFGSENSRLQIHILPDGDFELSYPGESTFTIPKRLRQSVADALMVQKEQAP